MRNTLTFQTIVSRAFGKTEQIKIRFCKRHNLSTNTSVNKEIQIKVLPRESIVPSKSNRRSGITYISLIFTRLHHRYSVLIITCTVYFYMSVFVTSKGVYINISITSSFNILNLKCIGSHFYNVRCSTFCFISFQNTIVVPSKIKTCLPTPIMINIPTVTCRKLKTIITNLTSIHRFRFTIGCTNVKKLITKCRIIISNIKIEFIIK